MLVYYPIAVATSIHDFGWLWLCWLWLLTNIWQRHTLQHYTDRSAERIKTSRLSTMPLYAVIGFDNRPRSVELRETHRVKHRAYTLADDQPTRLAGAMYDADGNQCGTLNIFEADNADAVWEWYRQEPFYVNSVYQDFHIVEWRLAMNRLKPKEWELNYPIRLRR